MVRLANDNHCVLRIWPKRLERLSYVQWKFRYIGWKTEMKAELETYNSVIFLSLIKVCREF